MSVICTSFDTEKVRGTRGDVVWGAGEKPESVASAIIAKESSRDAALAVGVTASVVSSTWPVKIGKVDFVAQHGMRSIEPQRYSMQFEWRRRERESVPSLMRRSRAVLGGGAGLGTARASLLGKGTRKFFLSQSETRPSTTSPDRTHLCGQHRPGTARLGHLAPPATSDAGKLPKDARPLQKEIQKARGIFLKIPLAKTEGSRARGYVHLFHQPSQVEQIDGFNTPSFETCNWT